MVSQQQHAPRSKILHVNLAQPEDIGAAPDLVVAAARKAQFRQYCRAQDALYVRELDGGIARLLRVLYGGKAEEIPLPFYGNFDMQGADPRVPGIYISLVELGEGRAHLPLHDPADETTDRHGFAAAR